MDFLTYLEKMKDIEKNVLEYIDSENDDEEHFAKLSSLFKDQSNKNQVKEIIRLIVNISNNHHRTSNFFNKIERILLLFVNTIQQNFNQREIFNIFISNKRLLLFLFDQKLIVPDKYVFEKFIHNVREYYLQYFYSEIKDFYDVLMDKEEHSLLSSDSDGFYPGSLEFLGHLSFSESFQFLKDAYFDHFIQQADNAFGSPKRMNSDDVNKNRKIGEDDKKICQLIREDKLNEFIEFINQENIEVKSKIQPSLFETNPFLLDISHDFSLIEYSAFCGSINVFKYLLANKAKMKSYIWPCAIHGNNAEIIHLIEEKNIKPENETFKDCYYEAIKCFHYEIADYIKNNYMNNEEEEDDEEEKKAQNDKYYKFIIENSNYSLFTEDLCKKKELFPLFCKFDYFEIVQNLIDKYDANINETYIEEVTGLFNDKKEKTAIHYVIENNNIDMLKFLLSKSNIDVNAKRTHSLNISGAFHQRVQLINISTPMTMVFLDRNIEIINLLLESKNIDVNLKESLNILWNDKSHLSYEQPPLIIAVDNKDIDLIKLLFSNENTDVNLNMCVDNPDNLQHSILKCKTYCPMHLVLLKNDNQMTNLFLNNPKVTIYDYLLDIAAFEQNDIETFKIFYNMISKKSVVETTKVFKKAIERWDLRILKVFLDDQKTNVNIKIDEELQYEKRPVKVHDKKMEQNYKYLLHIAVSKGDIEIIELLLKHENVDINCLSLIQKVMEPIYLKKPLRQILKIETWKKTPLFMAVESNNEKIVQLLMSYKGIDINVKCENTKEEIPYHSLHGDDGGGWVKDPNEVHSEYKTALQIAEEIGNQTIINILKQH